MAANLDSGNISKITEKEKELTGEDGPVKGGPTAQAQRHAGETINSQTLHDITEGEKKVTGGERVKGGPTSAAQSILGQVRIFHGTIQPSQRSLTRQQTRASQGTEQHSGTLDSDTISKITEKEKELTGEDGPVKGGPTAQAQSHANEPISSEALHDITKGEKKITGGERVKGGPTATAQSELGKSRS